MRLWHPGVSAGMTARTEGVNQRLVTLCLEWTRPQDGGLLSNPAVHREPLIPLRSSPSAPARLVTIQSVRQHVWIMDEPCALWIELGISAVSPPLSPLVSPTEMWKRLAERNQGNSHSIKIEEVSVLISCHGRALIHSFTLKAIKQALVERGRWQPGRDSFW